LSIYKPCDIRGKVDGQLTPRLYRRWGTALGGQLRPRAKFVIGGDTRASTPAFMEALADGLCRAGMDVVELGQLPTPMVYYAHRRLRAQGCAVVTASHNPADTNGLKWMIGNRPPTSQDVAALREAAARRQPRRRRCGAGSRRELDISYDYVGWLQQKWVEWRNARVRIVLDAMHGTWALRARRYLQAVFPLAVILVIRDSPQPDFGGAVADCSRAELLEALAETVDHERADLGIAFDGDGDRLTLVDNDGVVLTAEEATWVLLQSFGRQLSGKAFVYDQTFSDVVPRAAVQLGGRPLVERGGHGFICARMLDADALFGAEVSGHFFYGELSGGDDALMSVCRVVAFLADSGRSLAWWRRRCPRAYVTPDLRVPVDPRDHQSVLEHVQATWMGHPQRVLDGVRIDFPDGWALVRGSLSEPALTFRFESRDWHSLNQLVWRFCDAMPRCGDALWGRYEEVMGNPCRAIGER